MSMKKNIEVIAVNIKNNELISVKTIENASLDKSILISNVSSQNIEYFLYVDDKKYYFKVDDSGTEFEEPSFEILSKFSKY